MLHIRLLGQFDIRLDKKRITIPSRAGQSLFAYLVLSAGTLHRREKLAGTFWPDTMDEHARKNLRQELWRIRKALAGQPGGGSDYLLADEYTVAFNSHSDYWLDVAQLERPDQNLESLTHSVSLYQGELLPGFYEDWIVLERERIQALFDARMEQLLELLIQFERWGAAQEQGERWLALGNTPEPAFRALMLAYGARGDLAKVSSIYQRCVSELQNLFGIEPSAETRALYEGLIKGSHRIARTSAQPSGTVTVLMTDIEESTLLLEKLGSDYTTLLEKHHSILRRAIQHWNGHEVDTQGDAFFITFSRALDAVQCAAEAQRAFQSDAWIHNQSLRVRMGLHTGEPWMTSTGYVGMDIQRAARIRDAAHGGQVLLSQATRELILHELPESLGIRDLGEHRLKGLRAPLPLYQLIIDGLPSDFPPIRTKLMGTEEPTPGEPPFKGLQYFDESDAALFFGREQLTAQLIQRLKEGRTLSAVIGASGSGKSSLVRAGLIPALKKGEPLPDGTRPPPDSPQWQIHIITPTAHPLEALATTLTGGTQAVAKAATLLATLSADPRSLSLFLRQECPNVHILLVVDQLEELFTLCHDDFEREAFVDNLLGAIHSREGLFTLILTLRADFYAHLAQYPELREAVAKEQAYIGPMTSDELRRAIEGPAKRGHWDFEPGLVDLILRDVGDEPGALPLLSHALLETWKRRAGHVLTLKGYADAGGVHGAIAHTAESVYQSLFPEEQADARDIFLRLTELGEGTEDTRRRVSLDELVSREKDPAPVRQLLNKLADARLITLGEQTVEVAHEALIREWPALREWLNQNRESLRLHRRLTEAAQEWELLERDASLLYRGSRLAQAREWAAANPDSLNTLERDFLSASQRWAAQEQEEREEQQRRELAAARELAETQRQSSALLRTRNQIITAVGMVALFLAILAGIFGLRAESERRLAVSRELAIAAVNNLEIDPERSVLLALHALERSDTPEALHALHRAILALRVALTVRHDDAVEDVEYSPDGKYFATASDDGSVRIWDAETGGEILRLPAGPSAAVAFSPDGTRLATANFETSSITIWDATSGHVLHTLKGHSAGINDVVFSPDGTRLASTSEDTTARLWDLGAGRELFSFSGHSDIVSSLSFSPDGSRLATGSWDQSVRIWDTTTGEEVLALTDFIDPAEATFSPEDSNLLAINTGNEAQIWDLEMSLPIFRLTGHTSLVEKVVFSRDGKHLATVSLDGMAKVWDAQTGSQLLSLAGHASSVFSASFSPDGVFLATASGDGTARIWNISPAGSREELTIPQQLEEVRKVTYSPDGTRLAIGSADGTARVFDAKDGSQLLTLIGHTAPVYTVVFSPDGSRLATSSEDNTARIWDARSGQELLTLSGHGDGIVGGFFPGVLAVAYSPDGNRLATAGADGNTILWDARTGEELNRFSNEGIGITNLAFSPDGQSLVITTDQPPSAATGEDATTQRWDLESGEQVFRANQAVRIWGLAFDSQGKRIVTAGFGGLVKIRDAASGAEILDLSGHTGTVNSVAFSPDDQYIATTSVDGMAKLWDATTGRELLTLTGYTGLPSDITFSPDGSRLAVAGQDGSVHVYLLRIEELSALAHSRLTRSLTSEECQQYLHLEECPALP
jgi:WD40 repeat protein/class 3 adenylate cyclase